MKTVVFSLGYIATNRDIGQIEDFLCKFTVLQGIQRSDKLA